MRDTREILDGIGERFRRLRPIDQDLPETMRSLLDALEKVDVEPNNPDSVDQSPLDRSDEDLRAG